MGGKQKVANRTKGNVKPSSSARAAQMLESTGTATGSPAGFIGFGGFTSSGVGGDPGYVPAANLGGDDLDVSIDPDFRMSMRKLSKKDSTTKLKALQEICTLCKEKNKEDVLSVLPFWPRLYNKIATDSDRRVREILHVTMEQLVLNVGKNLAPHLKALMGTWLVAQCDIYPSVATAAKSSFHVAFPGNKQNEAVAFCKHEILSHIEDNLIHQTPQTLSDPKATLSEDIESKYHRIMSENLLALRLFITLLPSDQFKSVEHKVQSIVSNKKFWKLASSDSNILKAAHYKLISTLCTECTNLANTLSNKICPTILYNLDETDPVACPVLWEAVLHVLNSIQTCWEDVNARKGVLPKLWAMMKSGGSGSAVPIYPNLLPLLSKIPNSVIGTGIAFYQEFFGSLKSGLTDEKVSKVSSEVSAIVKAYVECIKYCMVHNLSQSESRTLTDFLMCDHALPLVEASFVDLSPVLSNSPLYKLIIDFLRYLKVTSDESDNEKAMGAVYLSELFWCRFSEVCLCHIESENQFTVARVGMFLQEIKESKKPNITRVKFETDEKDPEVDERTDETLVSSVDLPALKLIFTITGICLNKVLKEGSSKHLHVMENLCELYMSDDLCMYLSECQNSSHNACLFFLENKIFPLLENVKLKVSYSNIVKTVLAVMNSCSSDIRVNIVQKVLLIKQVNPEFLWPFFQNIHNKIQDSNLKVWFNSSEFGDHMLNVVNELFVQGNHNSNSSGWNYVKFSLSPEKHTRPLLGQKYVQQLFQCIYDMLPKAEIKELGNVDNDLSSVCDITLDLCSVEQFALEGLVEDLILELFKFEVRENVHSSDVISKVNNTWSQLMSKLLSQIGMNMKVGNLLEDAANILKFEVLKEITVERLDTLCRIGNTICKCIQEAGFYSDGENATLDAFTSWLALPFTSCITPQWEDSVIASGNILIGRPFELKLHSRKLLPQCISSVYFTTNVMDFAYQDAKTPEMAMESLTNLGFAIALCHAIGGSERRDLHTSELEKICLLLEKALTEQVSKASTSVVNKLVVSLYEQSLADGGLSALALGCILGKLKHSMKENLDILKQINSDQDICDVLVDPVLNTMFAILPHVSKFSLADNAQVQASKFLSCNSYNLLEVTGGLGSLALYNRCISLQEVSLETSSSSSLNVDIASEVLNQLQNWRDQEDSHFAFDCTIDSLDLSVVYFNIEVIRTLRLTLSKAATKLSQAHWDFILCSTVTWVQTVHNSKENCFSHLPTLAFTISTCDLLSEVAMCVTKVVTKDPESFPSNIITEWDEFFSDGAYSLMLPMFFSLLKKNTNFEDTKLNSLLKSLCSALSFCPKGNLLKHSLPIKLIAGDDTSLPDSLQTLLNHFCPLLSHENRAVQIASFRVLNNVIRDLPEYDTQNSKQDEMKEEISRSPPTALMTVLESSRHGLELLLHYEDTLNATVDPDIDEYTHIYAYLLSWYLLLNFFKAATSELRAEYAIYLRDISSVDNLMINLFRLMPKHPTLRLQDSLVTEPTSGKLTNRKSMFAEKPPLNLSHEASCEELQHLACAVYHKALQDLPAILRQWFNGLNKANASIVDKFTSTYVSPILCSEELTALQNNDVKMDNMNIKIRMQSREVVAIYQVEEVSMELSITLAANHPLGMIAVESLKRIGVANTQWRNWMLQLTTFLSHQNGSILDGLSLWKKNVDKRFEGLEDCMICFSVMHGSNCQLPKLQCKTCKNKYHSACLYKWFNSSNNSTCPLCRNLF